MAYTVTLGFALFAMFFGAGNLIFPPNLGNLSGLQFIYATLGFLLTGVGLPFLGVLAVAKAGGGLDLIASKVNKQVARTLLTVIMLAIGPFLAIPRTCATTYELGIVPNITWLNSWLFSAIFFGIVLFFALNPGSVVDRIGKILTPLLLLALSILIVKGIFSPIATPINTGISNSFGTSFVEGYQTMDLLAATIFGMIILTDLKRKGIEGKRFQMISLFKAGLISVTGLAVVYSGLLYLGATTSGVTQNLTRTELVIFIANSLLGKSGAIVLGLAVSMACLTTAIGLTVVCGEYFSKLTKQKLSYKTVCILVALVSLIFSNAGVESIIKIAVPLLVALYPTVIVLVILTFLGDTVKNKNIWKGSVLAAFIVGVLQAINNAEASIPFISNIYKALPLQSAGLAWLIPCIIFGCFGAFISEKKKIIKVPATLQS